MSDPRHGGGRSKGRARGTESGQATKPTGSHQHRPGPYQPAPAPSRSAWGEPSQPRAPAPRPQVQQSAGRALSRDVQVASSSAVGDNGGNGKGDEGMRRGAVRGRRQLHDTILHTKPETMSSKKGTTGTAIKLTANYFSLMKRPNWCLYQYRVDFAPEEDRTIVKKALFRRATANLLKGYAFDGTVVFTATRLGPEPVELFVDDEKSEKRFRIGIRLVSDIATGDFQNLQIYNIIMRKCLANLKMQLVGRNYYDAIAKVSIPEHKMELWPGYITSIRQHEKSVLMCCEISHKVMRHDTVLSLLQDCVKENSMDYKRLFHDRIVGTVVLTEYNNRTYTVDDVDFKSSPASTFNKRDGSSISYADYYGQRYNLRIYQRDQPMLVSRAKQREIRAGMAEIVYLVPELCRLTGLTDAQRSNFSLMRSLADHTRMRPAPRIQKLIAFIQRITREAKNVEELKQWDVQFANNLVEFPGRILPPETIHAGGNQTYSAGPEVDWTRELRARPMTYTAKLNTWVVMCTGRSKNAAHSFVQLLLRAANGMQWRIPMPKLFELRDDRTQVYLEGLDQAINTHNPQLIMCVVSNNKADRYGAIKKKCFVDKAMPTQVIVARNLDSKGAMSIATKVVIQMNCKLGGVPWSIPLPYEHMMVVGYDVCHDTNHKERSYGAMVATLSNDCGHYFSTVTPHTNGEELSNDFSLNIIKACREFQAMNKCLPVRIAVYRDGVGDGQLAYVFEHEVTNIRKRLAELYGGEDKFKLIFIVVSKRINTRIFYRTENPPPGTVVDDVITLPERYDFYIVSQCGRQGTVSPTSYNILYDSFQQPADRIQRITYKLTHVYYNWSGGVRVPAPCQYAHKLAFLVAQNLHRNPHPDLSRLLYFL